VATQGPEREATPRYIRNVCENDGGGGITARDRIECRAFGAGERHRIGRRHDVVAAGHQQDEVDVRFSQAREL
jgi:hypothetical protein